MMANRETIAEGAIVTPLAAATDVGSRVLFEGGSSVDAAIAANAFMAVAYPHMCAIGGDLFAVVRKPNGEMISINGSGCSARGLDVEGLELDLKSGSVDWMRGAHTVTVPGVVGAWNGLHKTYGRLPLSRLLEPAIVAARDGVAIGASLARAIEKHKSNLASDPGCRSVFFRDGKIMREGNNIYQPALAKTLTDLLRSGLSTFYDGAVARQLADGLRQLGIPLTLRDLQEYAPVIEPALQRDVNVDGATLTVATSPPNSQGLLLIRGLLDFAHSGVGSDPLDPETAIVLAKAAVRGAKWRDSNLSDASSMQASVTDFLRSENAIADNDRSMQGGQSGDGDTVGIVATDGDGLSISLIQSLYVAFGSARLEENTGVLLQNRGACFSLPGTSMNSITPGERPPHSLVPLIVERQGSLALVAGTMGGLGQPQILLQLLLRVIGMEMSVEEAVASPRWIVDPTPAGSNPWSIAAEAEVSRKVIRSLEANGFIMRGSEPHDDVFGHAQLISAMGESLSASSDPRADGLALIPKIRRNAENVDVNEQGM